MSRVALLVAGWKLSPLPLKFKLAEQLLNFVMMDQVIQQAYTRCNSQSTHERGKELHKKRGWQRF